MRRAILTGAFEKCEQDGWAVCPSVIEDPGALVAELADVTLVPLDEKVGRVRQAGATGVAAIEGRPQLEALAEELAGASGGWLADEVALGRYGPDGGITSHRDNTFYTGFVAVLTVSGRARFRVSADRAGQRVLGELVAGPGDLVLLRGPRPGQDGDADVRPFHSVGPPEGGGERVVIVLRRNSRGAGRGWS